MGKMKNSILKCKFFILLNTLKSKFYLFLLIQRIKTVKKASSQKFQTSCLWGENPNFLPLRGKNDFEIGEMHF